MTKPQNKSEQRRIKLKDSQNLVWMILKGTVNRSRYPGTHAECA